MVNDRIFDSIFTSIRTTCSSVVKESWSSSPASSSRPDSILSNHSSSLFMSCSNSNFTVKSTLRFLAAAGSVLLSLASADTSIGSSDISGISLSSSPRLTIYNRRTFLYKINLNKHFSNDFFFC